MVPTRGTGRVARAALAAALAAAAAACFALPTAGLLGRPAPAAARSHTDARAGNTILAREPKSLAELQSEARRVRAEMARLDAELDDVIRQWEAARQRLDEANVLLVAARRALVRSRNDLERQRLLVSSRVVSMYKTGEYTWVDLAASTGSLADAERVLDFLRRIASQDRSEEAKLRRLTLESQRLETTVERERRRAVTAQIRIDSRRGAVDATLAARAAALKDVVTRIKKILSAPELLMKAGGKVTQVSWAQALLKSLSMPITAENVAAIVAWEMAEGGHWYNVAYFNPLNTTQGMPGATSMNSVGVKAYTSWAVGLRATVITLHNGYYDGILAALRRGNDAQAVADAVVASPWGTGSFDPR